MVTAREPVMEPPHAQREAANPGHNRAAPAAPGSAPQSPHAPPAPTRPIQEISTIAKPAMESNQGRQASQPSYAEAAKSGVGIIMHSVANAIRGSARPNYSNQNSRDTGNHKRKDDDAVQSSRDHRRRREDDPRQNSIRDRYRRREEDTRRHPRDTQKKREEESEGVLLDTTELDLDESPQERDSVSSKPHEHRQSLREREQEQRERNKALSAQLQHLEAQNDQLQSHIQKMSHIIQQLQRQGLPQPPDDGHFTREFEDLTGDVRQWARLASKGSPPMTEIIWKSLDPETQEIISPAFADLQDLLATNPPRNLRTRFMELIIFKSFHNRIFGRRAFGVSRDDYSHLEGLWNSMFVGKSTSERDLHCWTALSIHLLTRDNESFESHRETKVDRATKKLAEQLKPLGAPGQATFPELRQMLFRAAHLGLQLAQLPFIMEALDLQPGMPFQHKIMEDIDHEGEGEELEICSVPVGLVLFPTVVKVDFDSNGNRVDNASNTTDMVVISKGTVVCQL